MSIDHSRLKELFLAACDLSDSEQTAFLNDQCGDAPELQQELKRLLRSDARHDGLFADDKTTDGIQFSLDTAFETKIPERIFRYRVKEVIGEGGMGVVYLARQQNPARDVAVKVIRPGIVSPDLLKRFELEAAVLGRLTHPGIANIYEADTFLDDATGQRRPYLAMEYIQGPPLCKYLKQAAPNKRDKLQLFVKICEAVHHAHQRGVIHRDLKPGNIMVKADGQPTILDFGVARATGGDPGMSTLQTRVGQLIGTLPYMSPEQVSGSALDVDTRSDIYSLGVICYELLSGRLPYDVEDVEYLQAAKAISEDQPIPLASIPTIGREFRGDLNTIVLKSLEKDANCRYQSAKELGDDVQRYLDNKPIEASPVGAHVRLKKWCLRNKAVALLSGLLSLAILTGFIGVTRQANNALAAKRLAEESQQRTERVLELIVKSFRSPDPGIDGRDVKMADVLSKAVSDLDGDLTEDPLLKAEILYMIGKSMQGLGMYDEGLDAHQTAYDIRMRELGEEHPETLASISNLASLKYQAGQYQDSMKLFVRSLELHTRVYGDEHPDTLKAMHNVAIGHNVRGELDAAIKLTEKSLEVQQRTIGNSGLSTIRTMNSLGMYYMLKGRHDEAYPILEESLQLAKDNLGDRHPTTIHSLGLYAWVCGVVRPVDETIPLHVEVMARFRDVLGENHPKTLDAMMNAAVAYMENDDESETIRLLEFALPKFREKVGDSHESTIISVTYLAEAYLAADRPHDALALLTASEDATSVQRFHGRRFLAESLLKTGQRETGAKMLKELLIIQRTEFAEDPAGMADALAQIAVRYLNANMHSEAEPLLREAQDLVNASSEPNDGLQSYVQSALGIALTESGKYDEAESLLLAGARGLLAERTEPPFPYPQNICESLRRLIRFYEITEQPLEAAKWRKIAVGRIPDDE